MAKSENSVLLRNVRGQIGKQIVVKKYGKKTVISAYPDMSNVRPSKLQKIKRRSFAEAVAYARAINNDPVRKALYKKKVKRGHTVFNYAIKEYLKNVE
jgi:hypothetical protein